MRNIIAVAKIGVDIKKSLNPVSGNVDPNDFIFHSDYNCFKIIKEATKTVTLAASTNNQSFTEAHGLSFIPLVDAFAKESGISRVFGPNSQNISGFNSLAGILGSGVKFNYVTSDITNLTFNFDNTNGSTRSISIRYFCLEAIKL